MLVVEEYKELVGAENLLRRLGFDVLSLGKDILVNDSLLRFHPDIVISTFKGRQVDGLKVAARVEKLSPSPRVVLAYNSINAPSLTTEQQARIDALVLLPFQPTNLIKVIALVANLDQAVLLGKYQKILSTRLPENSDIVVDGKAPETAERQAELQFVKGASQSGEDQIVKSNRPADSKSRESLDAVTHSTNYSDPWESDEPPWDPQKDRGKAATARSNRSDRYDTYLRGRDIRVDKTVPREKVLAAGKKLKRDSENEKNELDQIDKEKRTFVKALFDGKSHDSSDNSGDNDGNHLNPIEPIEPKKNK